MSHLEDLWGSFPSSEPPLGAIIAAAKAPDTARSTRRSLVAAVATVAAGAVVATALSSTGTSSGDTPIEYAAFQADLKPATSCEALLHSYRARAITHVTPYGWDSYPRFYGGYQGTIYAPADTVHGFASGAMPNAALASLAAPIAPQADSALSTGRGPVQTPKLLAQSNSATGTNVQEIGVDEPDSVKTNGTLIARLSGSTLSVFDASGPAIIPRGTLGLPYFNGGSILISGTTVIASGYDADPGAIRGGTRVDTISLNDPDHPSITSSIVYAGGNITALRQQGSVVRMIMSTGVPQLPFVYPEQGKRTNDQALAINKHLVATSSFKDWIPTYDTGSGPKQLLPCTNVAVPPAGVPLGTTSIVSTDVTDPTTLHAIGVAGTLANAYESQHNLYLTVGGSSGGCYWDLCPLIYSGGGTQSPTTILQFRLDGVRTTHVATGQVQGTIRNNWSMDEWAGILRVATTRFGPQPKPITVHQGRYSYQKYLPRSQVNVVETLVPHGDRLVRQGLLTGLGENQTLTAARWFDDLAIISTTNRIDPLYTIDLSDPRHPRQLGALHLPGDTQYIHPIASNRFMTISLQNVDRMDSYTQVAIFDTTDPTHVQQVDQVSAGHDTGSLAANDPRNFTWLPDRQTALTSFYAPKGMYLGEFTVSGDRTLTQRQITLTGNDSGARTFEVANGKVVLIFGGTVSYLNM